MLDAAIPGPVFTSPTPDPIAAVRGHEAVPGGGDRPVIGGSAVDEHTHALSRLVDPRDDPAAARRFQHAISAYADSDSTIISRASTAPRRVSKRSRILGGSYLLTKTRSCAFRRLTDLSLSLLINQWSAMTTC